jgi:hypothetical protein
VQVPNGPGGQGRERGGEALAAGEDGGALSADAGKLSEFGDPDQLRTRRPLKLGAELLPLDSFKLDDRPGRQPRRLSGVRDETLAAQYSFLDTPDAGDTNPRRPEALLLAGSAARDARAEVAVDLGQAITKACELLKAERRRTLWPRRLDVNVAIRSL